MALSNFIPSELMNEMILSRLRKNLVAVDVVSQDYAPMLSKFGDSVKIPSLTTSAGAQSYTRDSTISYSGVSDSSQILTIDQEKYFAYSIDMVDSQQSAVNIANETAYQAGRDLAEAADAYLLQTLFLAGALTIGGTGTRFLGDSSTAVSIAAANTAVTASGAINYLGRMSQRLDEADIPADDRWVICPPWFVNYLVQEKVLQAPSVDGEAAYQNGRVGRAYNFDVRTSTNLTNYNAASSHIYAGHKSAVQFAGKMIEARSFPMETKFAEAVRGLYTYGAKVVRGYGLAYGRITQV